MSLHAYYNLECLHAVKSRQGLSNNLPSPHRGTSNSEEFFDFTFSDLCTDINITYFRFDLIMSLCETLKQLIGKSAARIKPSPLLQPPRPILSALDRWLPDWLGPRARYSDITKTTVHRPIRILPQCQH